MKLFKNIAPGCSSVASNKGRAFKTLLLIAAIIASHSVAAAGFNSFGSDIRPQTSVLLRDMTQVELGNYKELKTLSLDLRWSKTSNISALGGLGHLTALNLDLGYSQGSDISVLKNLKKLTTLRLASTEARLDLRVLRELPELSTLNLDLQDSPIKDLSALRGLPKLTSLKLNLKGSEVTDVSVLRDMPNLTALELTVVKFDMKSATEKFRPGETPSIRVTYADRTNIGVLAELKNLTSLNLHLIGAMSGAIDISPLKGLKNLTTLKLELDNADADLGELKELTNLTTLSVNPRVHWTSPTAKAEVSEIVETLNALRNLKALHLDLRRVAGFGGYANELKKRSSGNRVGDFEAF